MMQEDVILEIPERTEEHPEWQPPVLTKTDIPDKQHSQSCADVFFMQYIICILLLTALFTVRLYDISVFQNTVQLFDEHSHADSEPWVLHLIELVKSLWN